MFALILAAVLLLAAVITFISFRKTRNRVTGVIAPIICIILALVSVGTSCLTSIETGHTGVVTTFGRVEDYTFEAGLHFKLPWTDVIAMDNRVQKETLVMPCFSSDIQEVEATYTVNYQIEKSNAQDIYRTIGVDYYNTVITPRIIEAVKTQTAKYTAQSLVESRSELASGIEELLRESLAEYNIELVSTSIENLDFTDSFTNAVEEKQVAAQNKLKAQTEAEQKVIEAQAEADVRVIEAQAEADAILAKAEAEAKANKDIAQSLTNELIKYNYVSNWDGKLPETMLSDGTSLIMDMTGNTAGD